MRAKHIKVGEAYVLIVTGRRVLVEVVLTQLGVGFPVEYRVRELPSKAEFCSPGRVFTVESRQIARTVAHQLRIDAHNERLRLAQQKKIAKSAALANDLRDELLTLTGVSNTDLFVTHRGPSLRTDVFLTDHGIHSILHALKCLKEVSASGRSSLLASPPAPL
jgi:hypothetical protein